ALVPAPGPAARFAFFSFALPSFAFLVPLLSVAMMPPGSVCSWSQVSVAQALGQDATDLALDRSLHRRKKEPELCGHVQFVGRQVDFPVQPRTAEIDAVAVPCIVDAELFRQPLCRLLDGFARAGHWQRVG